MSQETYKDFDLTSNELTDIKVNIREGRLTLIPN